MEVQEVRANGMIWTMAHFRLVSFRKDTGQDLVRA